jgi:thioesterase domain-containing protein
VDDHGIIVEMRGGTRPPFWLLHPLGGNVLFGQLFASRLAADQPLIGLQARGLDGRSAPFTSIPEAARFYTALVRERQPKGPYFLGGPSFGGNLAYEMARSLSAAGEHVGMVALFDAFGPGYPRPLPLHLRARQHVRRLRAGLRASMQPAAEQLYATARIPTGDSQALTVLRRVSVAHEHALRTYRASAYDGSLHLFRAALQPDWEGVVFDDVTNGWGALARGGVEVVTVPGTHQFILDPPWVHTLTAEFAKALRRATDACIPAVDTTSHVTDRG